MNIILPEIKRNPMTRSLSLVAALLFLLLFGIGCASHLHNPANQSLSQQAQEQFEALLKANGATFDSMVTNLATFSRINSELYEAMARKAAQLHARRATAMTWGDLRESFGAENPLDSLSKEITNKTNQVNEALKKVAGKSKEALTILGEARSELKAAKATVTSWNRRVAVLDKIIESTPSIKEALEQVRSPEDFRSKVEAYTESLKKRLGEQKVVYLDADGKGQTNTLTDEIKNMLGASSDSRDPDGAGKIVDGLSTVFNPKAPGLVITAASLAKDLAEAESSRLSSQLDSLESRLRGLEEAKKAVQFGVNLSTEALSSIPAADFPDSSKVPDTLKALVKDGEKNQEKIGGALFALSHYVTIHSECVSMVEEALHNDAQQQHLESIRISQINLRQHEFMAARGIESLLIYHSGGIKPEEIAEVAFQVMQLGLLSWIGGGIN